MLTRIELGVLNRGSLTPVDLFMEYLSNDQVNKAVLQMHAMKKPDDLFLAFSFVSNHLLVQETDESEGIVALSSTEPLAYMYGLLERYQEVFYQSPKYKKQFENISTRFFHRILR